jgi:hypothetical protein
MGKAVASGPERVKKDFAEADNRSLEIAGAKEELRIQHAMAALGYFVFKVEKILGSGGDVNITARWYERGVDEELMLKSALKINQLSETSQAECQESVQRFEKGRNR